MIPTIIITGLGLYWLFKETDYLRVRLMVGNQYYLAKYDISSSFVEGYDGSDFELLDDYQEQFDRMIEEFKTTPTPEEIEEWNKYMGVKKPGRYNPKPADIARYDTANYIDSPLHKWNTGLRTCKDYFIRGLRP